uniref:Uncharacterized protein n=1 Tax=Lepeophtheirus salmonis TaxID=72036 RepID=A0A0K2V0Z2_LEPSM
MNNGRKCPRFHITPHIEMPLFRTTETFLFPSGTVFFLRVEVIIATGEAYYKLLWGEFD